MNSENVLAELQQMGIQEVLEALGDGAYVTDQERRILLWNRSAARITGWPANEVVGRTCFDNLLVHIDKDGRQLCGKEFCPLHRAVMTGLQTAPTLVYARHRDGCRVPVEVTTAPLRNTKGEVIGGIEIFRDLAELMDDLRRARVILDHALDVRLPEDPRWEFTVRHTAVDAVGGDFRRVEPLGGDRYAVMVADVMGHGVSAALYTMQIRALWDDCRDLLAQPEVFMAELNRRASRLVDEDGYFATAVAVSLDAGTGEFRGVRAGHPAPLLFRGREGFPCLSQVSPALGLVPDARYRGDSGRIEPGDRLLLYTDGALEVPGPGGEDIGQEGLARVLAETGYGTGEGTLELVEQRLLVDSGLSRFTDDLTLLGVHRIR